jgi:hypothetical protein
MTERVRVDAVEVHGARVALAESLAGVRGQL